MFNDRLDNINIKLIDKIMAELRDIELDCSDIMVKEKLHNLIDMLEKETIDNKLFLEQMIKARIKETRGVNPALNTYFYLLYRNFIEGKITMKETQTLYDMYIKEMNAI